MALKLKEKTPEDKAKDESARKLREDKLRRDMELRSSKRPAFTGKMNIKPVQNSTIPVKTHSEQKPAPSIRPVQNITNKTYVTNQASKSPIDTSKTLDVSMGAMGRGMGGSVWMGGHVIWIIAACLLYASDIFLTRFNGFNINSFMNTFVRINLENFLRIFTNVAIISIAVGYAIVKKPDKRDFLSFLLLLEFAWLIFVFGGYSNIGVLFHLVYAGLIWGLLIKRAMPDQTQANLLVALCIFVDFFLFSLIAKLAPNLPYFNRLIIPIWFFLALGFTKDTTFKKILVFFVIMFYVFNAFAIVNEYNDFYRTGIESLSDRDIRGASLYAQESWNNFKNFAVSFFHKKASATLGEYYTGEIDRNAEQRLGVFLKDIHSADTDFYEDQPVSVWGTLSAQTIDKPVNITVGCKTKKKEFDEGVTIYPKDKFEIGKSEEEIIECIFDPGILKDGIHEVILNADFNFLTNAYIKTYFMDPETKRSLTMSGIDPLVNYGIFDGAPNAVYTSGPIMVGLAISSTPPLTIDRDFRLGITLTNVWEGKLKNITDVHIITPNEIEMFGDSDDNYQCRGKKEYTFKLANCQDIDEAEKGCDNNLHNVYILDTTKNNIGEIASYETLWCNLKIVDKDNLLGNVPLSTKYFKVAVKYDYSIYQTIGVNIKGGNGVRTVLENGECQIVCPDEDGCLCPDGCLIEKGVSIAHLETCGGESDGERTILKDTECSINCNDNDGCVCPTICNIEGDIDKDKNCGGLKEGGETTDETPDVVSGATSEKPTGLSIKINNDDKFTSSRSVTLSLKATNAKQCSYQNPSDGAKDWVDVDGKEWDKDWILKDPIDGEYWVWFYCKNNFGEAPGKYDTIKYIGP
jgi:hypothetical protein